MAHILERIPDTDLLLRLAPEELAYHLLHIARTHVQNGIFHPNSVLEVQPTGGNRNTPPLDRQMADQVEIALREAWQWLELNILVVPAAGVNGVNGFRVFSGAVEP